MKARLVIIVILTFLVGACSSNGGPENGSPKIVVEDAWTRSAGMDGGHAGRNMGTNGAAYMVIKNAGGSADKLLRAESDIAEAVELHMSEMKDGVMSMHPVDYIEIPAGGQTELKPGGLHIMLIGLRQELDEGEQITLKLEFEQSGIVTVDAEIRAP